MGLRPFAGAFSTATARWRRHCLVPGPDHDALQHAGGRFSGSNPCADINDLWAPACPRACVRFTGLAIASDVAEYPDVTTEIAANRVGLRMCRLRCRPDRQAPLDQRIGARDNNCHGSAYRLHDGAIAHMRYEASAGSATHLGLATRTHEFSISDRKMRPSRWSDDRIARRYAFEQRPDSCAVP